MTNIKKLETQLNDPSLEVREKNQNMTNNPYEYDQAHNYMNKLEIECWDYLEKMSVEVLQKDLSDQVREAKQEDLNSVKNKLEAAKQAFADLRVLMREKLFGHVQYLDAGEIRAEYERIQAEKRALEEEKALEKKKKKLQRLKTQWLEKYQALTYVFKKDTRMARTHLIVWFTIPELMRFCQLSRLIRRCVLGEESMPGYSPDEQSPVF